jgi:hypothetical protein
VITHWRSSAEKPRSRCADGSAMFTMVTSSTTISWAMPITTSASQRRSCGTGGCMSCVSFGHIGRTWFVTPLTDHDEGM